MHSGVRVRYVELRACMRYVVLHHRALLTVVCCGRVCHSLSSSPPSVLCLRVMADAVNAKCTLSLVQMALAEASQNYVPGRAPFPVQAPGPAGA